MTAPIQFLTERSAAERAVGRLQTGQAAEALDVLRQVMGRRQPPVSGPDPRSEGIVLLRAYIEQAIVELEHGDASYALKTLRSALALPGEPRGTS